MCQLHPSHHFSVHNVAVTIGSALTRRCPANIRRGIIRLIESRLEQILQRELCNTSITRIRESSERSAVADTGIRIAKVRVVEEVEEFTSELDLPKFMNRELLEQREIHVDPAGTSQQTSRRSAVCSVGCFCKRSRVEVGRHTAICDRSRSEER